MSHLNAVEPSRKLPPDQERLARLAWEIKRAALVWNLFAGGIIDGFYPPSKEGERTENFKGSDQERLEQLYKIRDVEVRYLYDLLRELGFDDIRVDYAAVYEQMSRSTEITKISHRSL